MNPIRLIRRLAATAAGLGGMLLLTLAAAPGALAMRFPSPVGGGGGAATPVRTQVLTRTVTHTVIVGGMPGWQIALIAAAAAVAAATIAVLAMRARLARVAAA